MPIQIESFLSAYEPKCICSKCLAAVTERGEDDVTATVMELTDRAARRDAHRRCLNCGAKLLVVGWRSRPVAAASKPWFRSLGSFYSSSTTTCLATRSFGGGARVGAAWPPTGRMNPRPRTRLLPPAPDS
jgi:hypothetical protein